MSAPLNRCHYCGEWADDKATTFRGPSIYLCNEDQCNLEFERDEMDTEQRSYDDEIADVNARYGRGY